MTMSREMWMREQERKKRERLKKARRRRNCALAVFALAIISVVAVVLFMSDNGSDSTTTDTSVEYTQAPVINRTAVDSHYTTTRKPENIKLSFYNGAAFAGNALAETIGMYDILGNANFYSNVNADLENVYTMTTIGSTASIVEQFKSKNFKKIFLAFGENELNNGNSAEFKTNYRKLIEKIKEYQPNVSIYLISIPPVTAEASDANINGVSMSRIRSYNKQIKTLAVEEDLYFVDSIDALGDNKDFLPNGVSNDGVNLNKAAVIDLLYYASKESYIPTRADLAADAEKEDEEDIEVEEDVLDTSEEKSANKPKETPKQENTEDSSTVNVLKSSVIKNKEE